MLELVETVDGQAAAQLRLEPGGLWRHYVAAVRYVYELVHRNGIKGEGHFHLSAVNPAGEFSETAYAAHEVYPCRYAGP